MKILAVLDVSENRYAEWVYWVEAVEPVHTELTLLILCALTWLVACQHRSLLHRLAGN